MVRATGKPNALIVGGTSGLGLALGLLLKTTHTVFVTGRHDPQEKELRFEFLDVTGVTRLRRDLDHLVARLPKIDLLIHAAAFSEKGRTRDFSDDHIESMVSLQIVAPAMLLQRLLEKQGSLPYFIAITSTSQITSREYEPLYCAGKAALAMWAECLALDPMIGKVLVAAPSGMKTRMQKSRPDFDKLLDPKWVAEEILRRHKETKTKFESWLILRDPPRSTSMHE